MTKELTHSDRATDLGVVRINNDAIATIASLAAMEIKGVHKMGGRRTLAFYELLTQRVSTKGVKIEMKNNEIKLTISIIVTYGVDIPTIADDVQGNVKRAVEKMTGLALSEVDVVVEGVHAQTLADSKARVL